MVAKVTVTDSRRWAERAPWEPGAREPDIFERTRALEQQNLRLQLTVRHLKRLAYVDGLTGLGNRRFFDQTLSLEIRRACRSATPLALILCDVDHFKRFNDCFGHQYGDAVLCLVSEILCLGCRRAGDAAARYGGEEFALLLPGLGPAESLTVAERLRHAVERLPLQRGAVPGVTVSFGVTSFHSATPCSPSDVFGAADAALYQAKNSGRNCTKYQAIVRDENRETHVERAAVAARARDHMN
jgi:diguanylate cyclase